MNYVGLMGRLTRDPELKQTSQGKSYCRFSIAVRKEFVKDGVDFINCVAWEKTADLISNYFKKGDRILLQGRINTGTYEVNGEKRTSFDIIVSQIEFLETRGSNNSGYEQPSSYSNNNQATEDQLDDDEFPF
ncbi:single-stranded DNA-binding protein [Oceanivirga miroungae]|uniref:Single-stranded DNA-binding protein n=1 Tax=Oceanivirga miroungae TaxID=1130046 RepID=A0A6I8M794_9FUSO|nr:single-stranded DNA-binding protein [Oceanivirga miroungae]VWL85377.1 single-strand binding protein [Oceanivirga miroungae]